MSRKPNQPGSHKGENKGPKKSNPEDPEPAPEVLPDNGEGSEFTPVIEELPDDPAELKKIVGIFMARMHSGPLPAPWTYKEYKDADPKAGDWILTAADDERGHRHWCEKELLKQARRGQTYAFTLGLLSIILGAFLLYLDKDIYGMAAIFAPLATVLGIFVYKEVRDIRSKEGKRQVETEKLAQEPPPE